LTDPMATLPTKRLPIENQAPVPLGAIFQGTPTTAIEVAIQETGEVRPLTVWAAHPGPNTPTVRGEYFVFARVTGTPKYAVCVGKLIMF
jgi:hypothetical protein